jgi:hypothetical protein
VWVGRAANYAAKLATLPEDYQTYITTDVYDVMHGSVRTTDGQEMWQPKYWDFIDDLIYCSTWMWRPD